MKTVWKRLSALVLALTMVLSLLSASVWADGEKLTITVGTVPAAPGELVEIPVTITGNAGIAGCALTVNVPDGVTLARSGNELDNEEAGHFASKAGGIFADGVLMPNKGDNTISLLSGDNVSASESNKLLMTLYVYAPAAAGTYTIQLDLADDEESNICNEDGDTVTAAFVDGTLTVTGDAHEHNFTTVDEVEPSGCKDGNEAYRYCSTCHRYYETDTETEIEDPSTLILKANGTHTKGEPSDDSIAPKYRQEGVNVYYCTVCGARIVETADENEELKALELGDVDGDHEISIMDFMLLNSIFQTVENPTDEQISICDLDYDDEITILDLMMAISILLNS